MGMYANHKPMPCACASYGDLHCYFLRGYNRVHVVEFVMNGIVRCLCAA